MHAVSVVVSFGGSGVNCVVRAVWKCEGKQRTGVGTRLRGWAWRMVGGKLPALMFVSLESS